jgi:hypothetical protein
MSAVSQTAEDVYESINGLDRIAIAQRFGQTSQHLAENDVEMFATALIFVVKRREGATDNEAYEAALLVTNKELKTFFAEPSDEESGKDEPPEPVPGTSLSSVS